VANESGRPFGVTLLIIIVVIQGLIAIVGGIALLSAKNDAQFLVQNHITSSNVSFAAFTAIGIGVLIVLVGLGLGTGSGVARILVALLTLLALIGGIYGIINYSGTQQTSSIVTTIIAVLVLYLLYGSQRNREFFRNN
jgi:predicted ABC-type exoprotein transport system permease subunit